MTDQSFIGKILDDLFPPMYGFCKHSYIRIDCEHYKSDNNKCHIWGEDEESQSKCTGRRA